MPCRLHLFFPSENGKPRIFLLQSTATESICCHSTCRFGPASHSSLEILRKFGARPFWPWGRTYGSIFGVDEHPFTRLEDVGLPPRYARSQRLMFSAGLALGGSGCACHDGEAVAEVSDESPALWAGGELAGWLQTHVNTFFGTKSSHWWERQSKQNCQSQGRYQTQVTSRLWMPSMFSACRCRTLVPEWSRSGAHTLCRGAAWLSFPAIAAQHILGGGGRQFHSGRGRSPRWWRPEARLLSFAGRGAVAGFPGVAA